MDNRENIIDPQKMDISDVSALIDYYCSDCCRSCSECLLKDFGYELYYTINDYNGSK